MAIIKLTWKETASYARSIMTTECFARADLEAISVTGRRSIGDAHFHLRQIVVVED